MGKPLYMGYGSCLLLRDYQTYDPLLGAISVSWSLLTLSRLWSCCSLTSQLWPHYCSPWTSLYHIFAFLDHLYSDNGEALSQKPYDNGWLVKLFERFPMLRTIHCLLVFRVLEWLPQKLTQKHFWLYFPHLSPDPHTLVKKFDYGMHHLWKGIISSQLLPVLWLRWKVSSRRVIQTYFENSGFCPDHTGYDISFFSFMPSPLYSGLYTLGGQPSLGESNFTWFSHLDSLVGLTWPKIIRIVTTWLNN